MHGTLKGDDNLLVAVDGQADGAGHGDTALAREAGDGAQVKTAGGTGKGLHAPTCHLTVSTGACRAIESEDAVTAPRGQVALPVMYERHGTRFEPTCSHVIAAEAFDTSSAANKATTRTWLFVKAAIAHSFSKALVGARFAW
jgi:hypothetical protein